jgi:hypothetical protein
MTVRKCINCKWLHVLNGNCIHPDTDKIGPRPNDDSCGRFEPAGQEETEGCAGGVDDEELYQWARSLIDDSASFGASFWNPEQRPMTQEEIMKDINRAMRELK